MSENKELLNENTEETVKEAEETTEAEAEEATETDEAEYDEEYYEEEYYDEPYEKSRVGRIIGIAFKILACLVAFAVVFTIGAEVIAASEYTKIIFNPQAFGKTAQAQQVFKEPLSEPAYVEWMGSVGEDVAIKNSEGYDLNGVYIEKYAITNNYVIVFHPYTADVSDMARHARLFYEMDFNVLVVESRGHGDSEYTTNNLGFDERYDVVDWVNFITQKDTDSDIFLFGLGSGGSTVLMASSLEMPANVKGIIADSAYANLNEIFKENVGELYNLPSFPTVEIAAGFIEKNMGFNPAEVDVVKEVQKSTLPIMVVISGSDNVVSEEQSEAIYDACTVEGSDRLFVDNVYHCGALNGKPQKYEREITRFILDNLDK